MKTYRTALLAFAAALGMRAYDVSSIMKGPVYREASYEQGRHQCNRQYYGHE